MQNAEKQSMQRSTALCVHNIHRISCTYCRKAGLPRRPSLQPIRIHPLLISAIIETAQAKDRNLPSNFRYWSENFAISYLDYLDSLPRLKEQSRWASVQDMLFASTHRRRGEYYWDDDDLEGKGPGTLPENVLANQLSTKTSQQVDNAAEPQGDDDDRADDTR